MVEELVEILCTGTAWTRTAKAVLYVVSTAWTGTAKAVPYITPHVAAADLQAARRPENAQTRCGPKDVRI